MPSDSQTRPPAIIRGRGIDSLTIANLFLTAVGLVGIAAVVRGYLLDIGIRYYDNMGFQFGFPRGVFVPSELRIVQIGYSHFGHAMGLTALTIISLCAMLMLNFSRQRRISTARQPRGSVSHLSDIYRTAAKQAATPAAMIFLISALMGVFTYKALIIVPRYATIDGAATAQNILASLREPGCPKCMLFGKEKLKGVAIFSDTQTLFVAPVGGGINRISLSDVVVTPLPRGKRIK